MNPSTIAATESAIEVRAVGKTFSLTHTNTLKDLFVRGLLRRPGVKRDRFVALDGIEFDVSSGEAVALLGLNGSGKSTLLKLMSGVMKPDQGTIGVRGKIAGLIEVGAGFHPDLTGRENVYLNGAILGMSAPQIDAKFDEIVEFSEIREFIDTEVKFYSSGMFLRLAFSVAVHTDPDVFLVDEILAVGDEPFQKKCLTRIRELKASGKALVIVSHDLDMVSKLCDRGILLERGRIVEDGPIERAVSRLRSGEVT